MSSDALFTAVIAALGNHHEVLQQRHDLLGYTVVGSTALLGGDAVGCADIDAVLLGGTAPHAGPAPTVLRELGALLREAPALQGASVWFVNATVPIVKLQRGSQSVDLLWLAGCSIRAADDDDAPVVDRGELQLDFGDGVALVTRYEADDPRLQLPCGGGAAADSILLTQLFRQSLHGASSTFTLEAVQCVRRFAQRRHIYGSKFGYPGGSAWSAMLWAFCAWLDTQPQAATLTTEAVVQQFFAALVLWPWPLPWTPGNMAAIVARIPLDASALEASIGRHQATAFVVPLPVAHNWNMTQCVQVVTQCSILREVRALVQQQCGGGTLLTAADYREEVRAFTSLRRLADGVTTCFWPLYLSIALPHHTTPEWRGIVGSRLMATVLPQLEACGFFPRPLCVDDPEYVILLWPVDALWNTCMPGDVELPLCERLMPCLFAMLQTAHAALWADAAASPPLISLLPCINVSLCDRW